MIKLQIESNKIAGHTAAGPENDLAICHIDVTSAPQAAHNPVAATEASLPAVVQIAA